MDLQKMKSGPEAYSTFELQVELVSLVLGCNLKIANCFNLLDPLAIRNFGIVARIIVLSINGVYPNTQSLLRDVACEFGVKPTTVTNVYYKYDNFLKVKSIIKENFGKLFC